MPCPGGNGESPVSRIFVPTLVTHDCFLHISRMSGSPLLRTFLILMVIAASGLLFVRVTAAPTFPKSAAINLQPAPPADSIRAKVRLTLSAPASSVELKSTAQTCSLPQTGEATQTLEIEVSRGNPTLEVRIGWPKKSAFPRFAKIVVEAPGEKTFTHVFVSPGEINDFVELPF